MAIKSTLFLALAATSSAAALEPRQQSTTNTATVNLKALRGAPQHLAAGFIYGIPSAAAFNQSQKQIPAHFYEEMGFNYARAGGGQDPQGGWIEGLAAYKSRFQATLQNYKVARAHGAKFQILPHDVWGTDHATESSVWPGDNGNWTDYDNFLDHLTSDIVKHDMLDGLDWDLWNEPDGGIFWLRDETQYLELWGRTYAYLRSKPKFNKVKIVGPSSAGQPSEGYSWWTKYLDFVVKNKTIPDQWTWHDEPGDVATDIANFTPMLAKYKAPARQININEYATFDQQNPAGTAWWISRLERYDAIGLRGNWLGGCQLYDFMASLLGKVDVDDCTSRGYYPNGEWQVYKYYNLNMTGARATTTGSADGVLDVYTTISNDTVRTLTGVLTNTGTWYITIGNLTAVGLPKAGTLNITTWGFVGSGSHYDNDPAPTNYGVYGHPYTGNQVTFPVFQTQQVEYNAWGFEFSI